MKEQMKKKIFPYIILILIGIFIISGIYYSCLKAEKHNKILDKYCQSLGFEKGYKSYQYDLSNICLYNFSRDTGQYKYYYLKEGEIQYE